MPQVTPQIQLQSLTPGRSLGTTNAQSYSHCSTSTPTHPWYLNLNQRTHTPHAPQQGPEAPLLKTSPSLAMDSSETSVESNLQQTKVPFLHNSTTQRNNRVPTLLHNQVTLIPLDGTDTKR